MCSDQQGSGNFRDTWNHTPRSINKIIDVVNRGDRFSLFNDATAQTGNLDNEIHPIFHYEQFLGRSRHMEQALQLASLFLTTDKFLEFFIPLTYGEIQTTKRGDEEFRLRLYKRDSRDQILEDQIDMVKGCLKCLSHCNQWIWGGIGDKRWGTTSKKTYNSTDSSPHTDECPYEDAPGSPKFLKSGVSTTINIQETLLTFYLNEKTGYAASSRCDQFRHDMQLATTLCHEIVHAYSAMAHGSLKEPWLAHDHPRNEQGWAWENFIFGRLLYTFPTNVPGTHAQLHRVWANENLQRHYGGLEYTAIPVAWTAQWFRKETWEDIEVNGLLAVPLPEPSLKIAHFYGLGLWIVCTDDEGAREDLERGRGSAALAYLTAMGGNSAIANKEVAEAIWMPMDKTPLAPTPQRHFEDRIQDPVPIVRHNRMRIQKTKEAVHACWTKFTISEISSTKSVSPNISLRPKLTPVRPSMGIPVAGRPMISSGDESSLRGHAKHPRDHEYLASSRPRKKTRRDS